MTDEIWLKPVSATRRPLARLCAAGELRRSLTNLVIGLARQVAGGRIGIQDSQTRHE